MQSAHREHGIITLNGLAITAGIVMMIVLGLAINRLKPTSNTSQKQTGSTNLSVEFRITSDGNNRVDHLTVIARNISVAVPEFDWKWDSDSLFREPPSSAVLVDDFNFDGLLDLAVLEVETLRGYKFYSFWLSDTDGYLRQSEALDEAYLPDPTFKPDTKSITTRYGSAAQGSYYVEYKWSKDGKSLVKIKETKVH